MMGIRHLQVDPGQNEVYDKGYTSNLWKNKLFNKYANIINKLLNYFG